MIFLVEAGRQARRAEGLYSPGSTRSRMVGTTISSYTILAKPPYQIATIYAGLGDRDRAFEWLEKAFQERSPGLKFLKTEPMLDNLRADKRFDDLIHRVENASAR